MRSILFCRRFLVLWMVSLCLGAAAEPVVEPEDISVLLRRQASGAFQALEMHRALRQDRSSFFGPSDSFLRVPGTSSPVRYQAGEPIQFYLRVFLSTADPRASFFPVQDPTRFVLYRLEPKDDRREVILTEEGLLHTSREGGRPLLVRLYGESSFVLSPSELLPAGEYALKYRGENDDNFVLFCFGVDAGSR